LIFSALFSTNPILVNEIDLEPIEKRALNIKILGNTLLITGRYLTTFDLHGANLVSLSTGALQCNNIYLDGH
jgi:hypothetical protein